MKINFINMMRNIVKSEEENIMILKAIHVIQLQLSISMILEKNIKVNKLIINERL